MPSHTHSASTNTVAAHTHGVPDADYAGGNGQAFDSGDHSGNYNVQTSLAGSHSHTVTVNSNGSGTAHNNIMPYLSVYCFKRTA